MTQPLLADLRQAAEAPAPKDFRPGITYAGRDILGATVSTGAIAPVETEEEWEAAVRAMGIHIPEGYGLVLVRAELAGSTNDSAWQRDQDGRTEKRNGTAYTAPATIMRWRYQFKVVLKTWRADTDVAVLMKEARRLKRVTPLKPAGGTRVIALADLQVGKVDVLGGTPELLERSEVALAQVLAEVKRTRPAQIVLVDPGDSTEGFESAPNAARTNDLQMTEQIRVWRRIFWRWIDALARLTEDLVVISVPSNHCRVRAGKNALGPANDDWGLEVLSQVADIAAVNDAYSHVRFIAPHPHEEHVLFTMADGKVLGVIHGHQANQPDALPALFKRNGRAGIGVADVIVVGHFHHLRLITFGDAQFMLLCPTMDGGSGWHQYSGERSEPGVASMTIGADGRPRDLHVAWAA